MKIHVGVRAWEVHPEFIILSSFYVAPARLLKQSAPYHDIPAPFSGLTDSIAWPSGSHLICKITSKKNRYMSSFSISTILKVNHFLFSYNFGFFFLNSQRGDTLVFNCTLSFGVQMFWCVWDHYGSHGIILYWRVCGFVGMARCWASSGVQLCGFSTFSASVLAQCCSGDLLLTRR
jgi:hypothetical protein